jgi:UTP--glucose-1-phosphate uridylyltransferase
MHTNSDLKAIIPVAGFGSRMLPATKSIPKEMLPLLDKPLVQYIVDECVEAGITEIVFVNHSAKQAIENHFDTQFEMEHSLAIKDKHDILQDVQNTCPENVNIISVRQHKARGLGHAVLCAHPVVGNEPFVVLLPDVILDDTSFDTRCENLASMVNRFKESGHSQIMLEEVAPSEVSKYGIGDLHGVKLEKGMSAPVFSFVEKPSIEDAPSNFAVVGRYVFTANIWKHLSQTGIGAGGEIQLTDAMDALLKEETVEAYSMVGKSHDCGNKLGYAKAFIEYASRDAKIGEELRGFMQALLGQK